MLSVSRYFLNIFSGIFSFVLTCDTGNLEYKSVSASFLQNVSKNLFFFVCKYEDCGSQLYILPMLPTFAFLFVLQIKMSKVRRIVLVKWEKFKDLWPGLVVGENKEKLEVENLYGKNPAR